MAGNDERLRDILRRAKWVGCKADPHEFCARAVFDSREDSWEAYQAIVAFRDAEPAEPRWVKLYQAACSEER